MPTGSDIDSFYRILESVKNKYDDIERVYTDVYGGIVFMRKNGKEVVIDLNDNEVFERD